MNLITLPIETPFGRFAAHYSEDGLAELNFPEKAPSQFSEEPGSPQIRQWHTLTTRALLRLLGGKAPGPFPPLDLHGTEFQKSVWNVMLKIDFGQTLSYAQVASAIGNPKATRAVGSACGANPIPVLVPCHRILAAQGKLGGFSSGLDWKRTLLKIERITIL